MLRSYFDTRNRLRFNHSTIETPCFSYGENVIRLINELESLGIVDAVKKSSVGNCSSIYEYVTERKSKSMSKSEPLMQAVCETSNIKYLNKATFSSVLRNGRNREIVKRYNGVDASQLAKEYGMCVNQLNRIVVRGI